MLFQPPPLLLKDRRPARRLSIRLPFRRHLQRVRDVRLARRPPLVPVQLTAFIAFQAIAVAQMAIVSYGLPYWKRHREVW